MESAFRHRVRRAPAALAGRRLGIDDRDRRRHVHDRAAAALEHAGEHRLDEHDLRDDVGGEFGLEQLDRRVLEARHVAGAGVDGVVHEDVDVTPRVDGALHGGVERRPVVQVHDDRQGAPTRRLDRLRGGLEAAGDRAPGPVGVVDAFALPHGAAGDHDVEPGFGERDGCRLADPPAGAGHEGDSRLGHGLERIPLFGGGRESRCSNGWTARSRSSPGPGAVSAGPRPSSSLASGRASS